VTMPSCSLTPSGREAATMPPVPWTGLASIMRVCGRWLPKTVPPVPSGSGPEVMELDLAAVHVFPAGIEETPSGRTQGCCRVGVGEIA
jgi:hypothetical protein